MEAKELDRSKLSPAQLRVLEDVEKRVAEAKKILDLQTPEHIKTLGKILRRSVEDGSLVELQAFLEENEVVIPPAELKAFRDHLIIHRVDLKDLEPAARERLFLRAHLREDSRNMTQDYREAGYRGKQLRCRDCRWFISAPMDGDNNGEKSCVELGTKGADLACYGFTKKPN